MVNNLRGLSLVELIVASLVSTIVIGGLFTVMQAMQNMSSNSGQGGYIATSAKVAVAQIIQDASLAVGSGTDISTKGILIGGVDVDAQGNPPRGTFCINQDTTETPGAVANSTVCYSQLTSASIKYNIYRCRKEVVSNLAACTYRDPIVFKALEQSIKPENIRFDVSGTLRTNVFSVTLRMRPDPSKAASSSNPEVEASGSVAPPAYRP